jgi:hypothetical protein
MLLFWGWESGLMPFAVIGSIILELPRWVRARWDFSKTDMYRVWDLCGVLFLAAMVYSYATSDIADGAIKFLPWLPIVFFPFVAAVAYSAEDNVRKSTYFLMFRRQEFAAVNAAPLGRYVPYWYLVVCICSSSIVNARDLRFYAGVAVLGAWLFWLSRNRTTPVWAWALAVVIASVAGFGGQIGLTHLQAIIENHASQYMDDFGNPDIEMNQTRTALGSVGKLMLSGRIVMRVQPDGDYPPPPLLRDASFDRYQSSAKASIWSVTEAKFTSSFVGADSTTWPFAADQPAAPSVTVSANFPQGVGILAVPTGPLGLTGLLAGEVETNRAGAVRAKQTLPLVRYSVKYGTASTLDGAPTGYDLVVPKEELPAITQIATMLGLAGRPPAEVMRRIASFFAQNFTYTRYLKGIRYDPLGKNTALRQFLLQDHTGHCEYFATATALLLRQAGIPARYAIGFAMPEDPGGGHVYLVRGLHAHAWVLAYVNGSWHDFDTTPGSWEGIEEAQTSFLQPVSDFFSSLWYYFTRWRYYSERGSLAKRLLWFVPVALAWILWRLFGRRRIVRKGGGQPPAERSVAVGLDSEFYLIEQHLARAGVPRRPGESLNDWADRVETARQPRWPVAPLREIIARHYAYRFDPQGLTADQRRDLKSRAETWLENAAEKKASTRRPARE